MFRSYKPKILIQGNSQTQTDKKNKTRFLIKLFVIFGVPIIAIILGLFIFRIYHVKGPSMEPTLQNDQKVIIQKFDKTLAKIKGETYIPSRYDIIVLSLPQAENQVIKRVIGLPGERVIIDGGGVIIVNQEKPEGYQVDNEAPSGTIDITKPTVGKVDVTLTSNEIFVLGDNREFSEDSRTYGPVPVENIVGKAWDPL